MSELIPVSNPAQAYSIQDLDEVRKIIRRLNEQHGLPWRLPSEAEWQSFALGDGFKWPWGDDNPERGVHAHLNFLDSGGAIADHPLEAALFSKGSTRSGLFDLVGNVYDLVVHDGGDINADNLRLAGGAWTTDYRGSTADLRWFKNFTTGAQRNNIGLRLVCPV